MNILFYTTNEVAPQYGGVERVTANIANAPDITSGNSATTDNDTAHNIGITVSVNNNGSVSDYTKNLTDGSYDTTINLVPNATVNVKADENIYGLYIIWSSEVTNYTITYNSQTVKCGENGLSLIHI